MRTCRIIKAVISAAAALLTAAALFVSCGCATIGSFIESFYYSEPVASQPAPTHENAAAAEKVQAFSKPTTEPSPEPEPDFYDDFFALVEKEFFGLVSFDIGFEPDVSLPFAEDIGAHKSELLALEDAYRASAEEALPIAVGRAAHEFDVDVQSERLEGDMPSWQLAVSLSWACGRDRGDALLRSHSSLDMSLNNGALIAKLVPAEFDPAAAGAQPEERFTADFIYSYYLTVYDDAFEEAEYVIPALSQKYVSSLCYPLDEMYFYDTWYGPRQYSTRYHLGMDIHAWRDANIYSCTDGAVTMLGFDDTAGYYVVIEDAKGFEYHYYHMIRYSDFLSVGDEVTSGQRIGNVGRTGNSDGYHLHLSIISPEHVHLNPYNVMCALRDMNEG